MHLTRINNVMITYGIENQTNIDIMRIRIIIVNETKQKITQMN